MNLEFIRTEVFMTEKEVIDLIKTGSLDAWLDCLDFAPNGVIEMIKSLVYPFL